MISTSDTAPIRRMAVLGVGLMGGSLALAARRRARVLDVRGYDEDPRALEQAFSAGVITRPCSSVAEAAAGADLVVVCAPVRGIPGLVREALSADPAPRLVTDIGSTKTAIVSGLSPADRRRFIGGHPICGAETSGVRFAREDLFHGATYFLCPTEEVPAEAYEMLHAFVTQIGAKPVAVEMRAHDRIMALVSHVPHVIANVLMSEVGAFEASGRRALYSVGPSFKDLTRVAGTNPPMWRDIFVENRPALVDSLRRVAEELVSFCEVLESKDEDAILSSIGLAGAYRQELLAYEDITPETLFRVTVRIPDRPGVLSRVMTALGSANINIEDLTLHHFSRDGGGDLVLYVSGEETAATVASLAGDLGYPAVFSGGPGA